MSDTHNPTTARPHPGSATGETSTGTTETLKREGAALLDDARSSAEDIAKQGVQAGAERAGGLARAIHRAADAIEPDAPSLARTIHDAAGSLDGMARRLQDRGPGEILHDAEAFARRQPVAFFAVAALAGFAVARFATSSAERRGTGATDHGDATSRHGAPFGAGDRAPPIGDAPAAYAQGGASGGAFGGASGGSTGFASGGDPAPDSPARPATLGNATLGGAAAQPPRGTGAS